MQPSNINRSDTLDGRQSMMRRRRETITKGDAKIDAMKHLQDDDEEEEDQFAQLVKDREESKDAPTFGANSTLDKGAASFNRMTTMVGATTQSLKPVPQVQQQTTAQQNRMTVADTAVKTGRDDAFFSKLGQPQPKQTGAFPEPQVKPPPPIAEVKKEPSVPQQAPLKQEVKPTSGFDALLSSKPDPIQPSAGSRPHMSMQVTTGQKLEVPHSKATAGLNTIHSDSEDEGPMHLSENDPRLDQLLPEEDPENHLSYLKSTYNPNPVANVLSSKDQDAPLPAIPADEEPLPQESTKYMQDFYLVMHEDIIIRELEEEARERERQEREKLEEQREKLMLEELKPKEVLRDEIEEEKIDGLKLEEQGFRNAIRIIDWNERRHQHVAKQKLKQHSELSTALRNQDKLEKETSGQSNNLRILTGLQTLNSITNKLVKERQYSQAKATSLAISDDLLFLGTSDGQVWMFDRENEDDYDSFSDKSKEFLGNSVTAIDIHSLRSEYAIIGYERGQLVLFDATEPKKSVKTIKDHHQGASVIDIKFCDWSGGKSFDKQDEFHSGGNAEEDPKAWMFISIDSFGRVILNTVQKKLFVMTSNKHVIVDPTKQLGPFTANHFSTIACRFHSQMHGHGLYDDQSIFAIGSVDQVIIMDGKASSHQIHKAISAPFPKCPTVAINWGHGMTPLHMDRPHSLLAIAWGPYIQVVVLIDHEEREEAFVYDGYYILRNIRPPAQVDPYRSLVPKAGAGEATLEQVAKMNPLEESLSSPDLQIEVLHFISDSTILVVTQMCDVRVVHTHSFLSQSLSKEKDRLGDVEYLDQLLHTRGDLESGISRVQNLLRSDFVRTYAQSTKFFAGKLAVLTQKNVQTCIHLTWQQSIYEFKRQVHDDLIQVFSRAISIYNGKVKGYRGLLDNSFLRENLLKAELKLLVKEIIQQVVEKTKQESDRIISETLNEAKPLMDREGDESKEEIKIYLLKLDQFEDEKKKKFETLVRIAIEFCVELRDCDFLFKDLFWLFQEEKIEKLFVQELEPFIMAGRLQDWELPNEVIQNHVIKYYKDPAKAEALEKIIVNLNLKKCPKTIILEFIHFSEMHFLTTAVLFLYTQVFEKRDNTSCTTVLCSVFDLYKKASKKARQEIFKAKPAAPSSAAASGETTQMQHIDINMLKDASYDSIDKLQIERSQTYLGYKILWILNLFINGKKFPSGKIRESMWRAYIHDILEFLSNPDYLKTLLSIDAETVFQMISVIFYPTNPEDRDTPLEALKKKRKLGPYELVKMGREEDEQQPKDALEDPPHWRFMKVLDMHCIKPETPEGIRFQYFFFVANIVANSPAFTGFDPSCYLYVAIQLLQHHKRYIEFVKKVFEMSVKTELISKGDDPASYILQQGTSKERERLRKRLENKVENDIILLLQRSEPISNLQMQDVVKYVENTDFNKVKKDILEKRGEYIKSLQMLLLSEQTSAAEKFQWIQATILLLEERAAKSGQVYDKNIFEGFKREVVNNFKTIVGINVRMAIEVVDTRFNSNHKDIIDQLGRDSLEQLVYMDGLTDNPENAIQSTVKSHFSESTNPQEAKKCIELLKQHVRLCCINKPQEVVKLIKGKVLVKNSGYPLEECLAVCQEFKQFEGMFYLSKKLQKYYESVTMGIKILREQIDVKKIRAELFFCKENDISTRFDLPKSKKQIAAEIEERERKEEQTKRAAAEAAAEIKAKAMVVPVLSKNGKVLAKTTEGAEETVTLVQHKPDLPLPETLAFFDSIFGRLIKICLNHSKEVDQKHEDTIWFMVVDVLLDTLRPLYLQKKYTRDYFNHRFYSYIEALVKVHRNGFSKLLDHLVKSKGGAQSLKYFHDLSEVIFKIFGDQHLEKLVLENANNSIRKVNSDIFEQFSQLTRAGYSCRQRVCGRCKRYVDQYLYEDSIAGFQTYAQDGAEVDEAPLDLEELSQDRLHVFACTHTFHVSCLKRYYLKKFGTSPAARDEIERMFKSNPERLRCVTCNLKNLEVEDKQAAKQRVAPKPVPQTMEFEGDQVEEGSSEEVQYRPSIAMTKSLNKLGRLMETFEKQQGSEGKLTIKDFKHV